MIAIASCGPKMVAPLPTVTAPKYPEYIRPAVPAELAAAPAAMDQERGWTYLQAGDLKSAEREFDAALKLSPEFYPAEFALGYVELARKDERAALMHFDRGLERRPSDPSGLVGRGEAALALGREADALASFQMAVAADPSLTDIQRRVDVLVFRRAEQNLATARGAARTGRLDDAIKAYAVAIAESPDSPFLYRELAGVERQKGDSEHALEHFRKAAALDPNDAASLVAIGDILADMGDLNGATASFTAALAIDRDPAVEAKVEAVRARADLAKLPPEYRAIDMAPQVTRADLAALVGIRLAPLVQASPGQGAVVITDVRAQWAAPWIMAVTQAGVMDAFANHTFQPRTVIRRVDLARIASRLLTRIAARQPARAKAWETARVRFTDLPPTHADYAAASMAVSAGVLAAPDGALQPNRPVTGTEAVEAISRLQDLANLPR